MQTVKLFFVKDMDCHIFGWKGNYALKKPPIRHEWYTEKEYLLPKGYTMGTNRKGTPCICNANNEYCPIIPDSNNNPVLADRKTFVQLQTI